VETIIGCFKLLKWISYCTINTSQRSVFWERVLLWGFFSFFFKKARLNTCVLFINWLCLEIFKFHDALLNKEISYIKIYNRDIQINRKPFREPQFCCCFKKSNEVVKVSKSLRRTQGKVHIIEPSVEYSSLSQQL